MKLRVRTLDESPLADAASVLNAGFSGYIVKVQMDTPMLLRGIRFDQIDCSLSWIVEEEGRDIGACLVVRRGWSSRLASMALIPEARNRGVGTWLVERLLREAKARGDKVMELEVIEGNDPAVSLYQANGFKTARRLLSFQASALGMACEDDILEVDIREIADNVTRHGLPDLPWQISGESLAQMGPPSRGYELRGAYIIISDPEKTPIAVRTLITKPGSRGQGLGMRVLHAAMAKHPDTSWMVPALCPQEFEAFFLKAGFETGSLAQFQMSRQLT